MNDPEAGDEIDRRSTKIDKGYDMEDDEEKNCYRKESSGKSAKRDVKVIKTWGRYSTAPPYNTHQVNRLIKAIGKLDENWTSDKKAKLVAFFGNPRLKSVNRIFNTCKLGP